MSLDSIVVVGGKARRLGGIDKTMLPLGGSGKTLLQAIVDSCPGRVVAVGAMRPIHGDITWVSDEVSDGGPAVGLWSALPHVSTEYVFITAADQRVMSSTIEELASAAEGHDGAWVVRADGSGQPLCACVRTRVLRELLEPTHGVNQSPLRLLSACDMVGISVKQGDIVDVDTWRDVAHVARHEGANVTQLWIDQLAQALGIDAAEIPVDELLDLTRDVAHGVERKAAPLTTFMLGLAAGQSGRDLNELIAATQLALEDWAPDGD